MLTPYNNNKSGKKDQVAFMFNNIARRYDFLNHFLSLGIDKIWRRKLVNTLKGIPSNSILLDVATGTGDVAIVALKHNPKQIIGIDISEEMLRIGIDKIKRKKLDQIITLQKGDSENIEFESDYFDGITVAFGVRNYENLNKGLSEMYRVLKPSGKLAILEFSKPKQFPVKQLYSFYFKNVLPFFGKIISKDKAAYKYLHDSAIQFPEENLFITELEKVGFKNCKYKKLSFGIASIYNGIK